MRRANDPQPVKDASGTIYAINLGADFCAEHEWGVKRLRSEMGITENEPRTGLNYHTAKKACADALITFTSKKQHFIIVDGVKRWYIDKQELIKFEDRYKEGHRELGFITWRGDKKPKVLSTAWDEGSFGIVIGTDADADLKAFGKKLVKAIETGDFAVWFGGNGGNPFSRSGLVVAITSLVPQEVKDYMAEAYAEQLRLEKVAEDTGVIRLLEEKGKRYFACSPKWADDTKTTVRFWLNPFEQDKNNYGWFTAAELSDWANGVPGNKIDKVKK